MKSSVVNRLINTDFLWNGAPGIPFTSDDNSVDAKHGMTIMVAVPDGDSLIVVLPAITPESTGKSVFVRNTSPPKTLAGQITFVCNDLDTVETISPLDISLATLQAREILAPVSTDPPSSAMASVSILLGSHAQLISDGIGNWSFLMPNSGLAFLTSTG